MSQSTNSPRPAAQRSPATVGENRSAAPAGAPAPGSSLAVVAEGKSATLADLLPPTPTPMWNLAHRNGMMATAQAACWLVLAGFSLREKKKEIGHGGFLKWVGENCEYGERTARNYMELAEGIEARAKSKKAALGDMRAEDFQSLLGKSAGALDESEQLRLLKAVHGLTGENTIRQLYLDFGIIKARKQLGGDSRVPCPKCQKLVKSTIGTCPHCGKVMQAYDPNSAIETARDLLLVPLRDVAARWREQEDKAPMWTHLPHAELHEIDGLLMDLRADLKAALKKEAK